MRRSATVGWGSTGWATDRSARKEVTKMSRWFAALLLTLTLSSAVQAGGPPFGPLFIRGDADGDGQVLINDAVFELAALFVVGAPYPSCEDAADTNDDGAFNISDPVFILGYLFTSGPTIPEPFPFCGPDPTDFDALFCDSGPLVCIPPTYQYVLNAPSRFGGGNDSVLRVTSYEDGTEDFDVLLPADGTWNGAAHIEEQFGTLIVSQELSPGLNRVSVVDSFNGTVYQQHDGITGDVLGLAVDDFQYAYLLVSYDVPVIEVQRLDLYGTDPPSVLWSAPGGYDVSGVGVDWNGNVYFGATGAVGTGVFRVTSTGSGSLLVPLTDVGRVRFDFYSYAIWVLNEPPGQPMSVDLYTDEGDLYDTFSLFEVSPGIGDYGLGDFEAYIPVPSTDEVLVIDLFFGAEAPWTSADGIDSPIDVAAPTIIAVP